MRSLFFRDHPFFESERSLLHNSFFNDDDDDVFNDNHFLHSLIPSGHLAAMSRPHYLLHHYRSNPYNVLEKQLTRALKHHGDHDVFKLVDFSPKINVSEDNEHYYVHADLPGMTKDQVKMEISEEDHTFTISGKRESIIRKGNTDTDNKKDNKNEKVNNEEKKGKKANKDKKEEKTVVKKSSETKDLSLSDNKKYSLVECSYGKFKRSFTLPDNVDLEHISAKMENGVLEVTFNKLESDEKKHPVRTIEIN